MNYESIIHPCSLFGHQYHLTESPDTYSIFLRKETKALSTELSVEFLDIFVYRTNLLPSKTQASLMRKTDNLMWFKQNGKSIVEKSSRAAHQARTD
jgi:hypothetical protein